jgi:uncharacterized protein YqjF (DUF2071 family)
MRKPGLFMTAEWKWLVMANYAVEPSLLEPLVPRGTELDSFDGRTYVSLIGFLFNRSRIFGVPIPLHQSFEEVNLRFYVRRRDKEGDKRGVVFIRELVPRYWVATIARLGYNENYSSVPMSHRIQTDSAGGFIAAEYAWGAGPHRCSVSLAAEGESYLPVEGSLSEFITEHFWGYAGQPDGSSKEYEVQHPQWPVQNAREVQVEGDHSHFYGDAFGEVLRRPPDSAFLALGSAVQVYKGTRID